MMHGQTKINFTRNHFEVLDLSLNIILEWNLQGTS